MTIERIVVVPDEGAPEVVRVGVTVCAHCARAFTPLNTQRRHTEIQELWKCMGYRRVKE